MKRGFLKLYVSAQILREDHGQDLVEYALIAALIALGCVAAMKGLASSIGSLFSSIVTNL